MILDLIAYLILFLFGLAILWVIVDSVMIRFTFIVIGICGSLYWALARVII